MNAAHQRRLTPLLAALVLLLGIGLLLLFGGVGRSVQWPPPRPLAPLPPPGNAAELPRPLWKPNLPNCWPWSCNVWMFRMKI